MACGTWTDRSSYSLGFNISRISDHSCSRTIAWCLCSVRVFMIIFLLSTRWSWFLWACVAGLGTILRCSSRWIYRHHYLCRCIYCICCWINTAMLFFFRLAYSFYYYWDYLFRTLIPIFITAYETISFGIWIIRLTKLQWWQHISIILTYYPIAASSQVSEPTE